MIADDNLLFSRRNFHYIYLRHLEFPVTEIHFVNGLFRSHQYIVLSSGLQSQFCSLMNYHYMLLGWHCWNKIYIHLILREHLKKRWVWLLNRKVYLFHYMW